ncbi:MAG: hypothetical protein ACO4AU_15410 [bacterium]|jgi:hypothetical protein
MSDPGEIEQKAEALAKALGVPVWLTLGVGYFWTIELLIPWGDWIIVPMLIPGVYYFLMLNPIIGSLKEHFQRRICEQSTGHQLDETQATCTFCSHPLPLRPRILKRFKRPWNPKRKKKQTQA